jgi:neuronal cell adhesion protein
MHLFIFLFIFRKQKETQWVMSEEQLNENSVVVQGLDPGHVYEFRVVAVDGRFETPSAVQDIHTYAHLPSASDRGSSVLSSSGWFIGIGFPYFFIPYIYSPICLMSHSGFRNRIHLIRIRIQHFRLNSDPDPGFL